MIHFIQYIFQTFLNWNGASNTAGTTYGFWSGFGSDLGEFAIVVAGVAIYKRHNCPVKGCPRLSHHHHPVAGTPLHTCKRHDTAVWHKQLAKDYKANYPHRKP